MTREYLVSFGRTGHLGRFAGEHDCSRGQRIVISGTRGVEIGEVLGEAKHPLPDPHVGQILRIATSEDDRLAQERESLASRLCIRAASLGGDVAVLDAEVMLDGRGAVLHALAGGLDAGSLLDRLAEEFGLIVRLYDLAAEPVAPADAPDHEEQFKCDKPDCGEGECTDCGSEGGCNSCSAGSKDQVMEYFAGLREKMETRVPLV